MGMQEQQVPVGDLIVNTLEHHDVRYIFGLPGTALLPMLNALKNRKVRFITTRHEQVAALMAVGYARASGKIGICMGSRGPAAANMTMGIHDAHQGSIPVVAMLGQVSRGHLQRMALQEIDMVDFFRPITKWAVEVPQPERVGELLHRALSVSRGGRPGPVMVSVPTDILLGNTTTGLWPVVEPPRPRASEDELRQVVELLHHARRPLIMAGGGILAARASDALARFAEAAAIPVVASYGRNDLLPNSHPYFFGHMGLGAADEAVEYAMDADVVLAIGTKLAELSTMGYKVPSRDARLIHIDLDPDAFSIVRPPSPGLVAEALISLEAMNGFVPDVIGSDPVHFQRRKAETSEYRARIAATWELPVAEFRETPIHPAEAIQAIQAILPHERLMITCDAGSFSRWIMRYLKLEIPGSWMVPTSGGMGFGLPAAMGAQLALPDHLVINLAGDGGFLMTCQDLETAVRERLPVLSIVFNNDCYGTIKDKQLTMYDADVGGSDYGNPDFALLAQSFGAFGEKATRASEIPGILDRALAYLRTERKPAVVEIPIDPALLAPSKPTIA